MHAQKRNDETKSVLVTRPKHQAEHLCLKLETYHFHPVRFPAIEIVPVCEASPQALTDQEIIIFTSANAVYYAGHDFLQSLKFSNQYVLAMGMGTKHALRKLDIKNVIVPPRGADSESMLELIHDSFNGKTRTLIVTGIGGRNVLLQSLKKKGLSVEVLEVYQRALPKLDEALSRIESWCDATISFSMITSQQTLENLFKLVPLKYHTKLYASPMITASPRIKEFALQKGAKSVYLANSALDDDMTTCLLEVSENLLQCSQTYREGQ